MLLSDGQSYSIQPSQIATVFDPFEAANQICTYLAFILNTGFGAKKKLDCLTAEGFMKRELEAAVEAMEKSIAFYLQTIPKLTAIEPQPQWLLPHDGLSLWVASAQAFFDKLQARCDHRAVQGGQCQGKGKHCLDATGRDGTRLCPASHTTCTPSSVRFMKVVMLSPAAGCRLVWPSQRHSMRLLCHFQLNVRSR